MQGFGMTESSGCVAVSHPDRIRAGSSGQLLPGTQARVVDPATGADARAAACRANSGSAGRRPSKAI